MRSSRLAILRHAERCSWQCTARSCALVAQASCALPLSVLLLVVSKSETGARKSVALYDALLSRRVYQGKNAVLAGERQSLSLSEAGCMDIRGCQHQTGLTRVLPPVPAQPTTPVDISTCNVYTSAEATFLRMQRASTASTRPFLRDLQGASVCPGPSAAPRYHVRWAPHVNIVFSCFCRVYGSSGPCARCQFACLAQAH